MKPRVRFKGFTDDWVQCKLEDLYNKIRNAFVGTATPFYVQSGHFYLESNNIKNGMINTNAQIFINDYFYFKQKDKWLNMGDIVMVQSGHVGHTAVIPAEFDKCAAHAVIMFQDKKEEFDSHFLNYQFQTNTARKKIDIITTGNTIQHILSSDMKKFSVYVAEVDEQAKISQFFKTLDDTIALHQRKLDKLQNSKAAYMSEMFPAFGMTVPKRRFSGFTSDWEQCSWRDKVDMSTNMVDPRSGDYDDLFHIGPGNIESFTGRILKNIRTVKEEKLISGKFYFSAGNIIYGKINPQLGKYAIPKFHGLASADSYVLIAMKGLEQLFLFTLIQEQKFFDYTVSVSMRTGMPKINREELNGYKFYAPIELEQTKIGQFFKTLDDSIELQKRKIEKLNNLKAAYLDSMFI